MSSPVNALIRFHTRVKSIGYSSAMDNYEKRRLGIRYTTLCADGICACMESEIRQCNQQ